MQHIPESGAAFPCSNSSKSVTWISQDSSSSSSASGDQTSSANPTTEPHDSPAEQSNPSEHTPAPEDLSVATSSDKPDAEAEFECPFCKYMRGGGCAAEFDAFMDCGEKAEKGDVEYSDCLQQFESMKLCMEANRQNYLEVLEKVDDMKQQQEGSARQEPAATALNKAQEERST